MNYLTRFRHLSGSGSVVGIATGYGLDGPGIKSRWGRDFPHLSRPALGTMGTGTFPGVKSGWGVTLTPRPLQCRGHGRVQLLYSPYGPYGLYSASVSVQGCTLPLPLPSSPAEFRHVPRRMPNSAECSRKSS